MVARQAVRPCVGVSCLLSTTWYCRTQWMRHWFASVETKLRRAFLSLFKALIGNNHPSSTSVVTSFLVRNTTAAKGPDHISDITE
eukprot:3327673-Amphidinium_carterae.1